MNNVNVTLNCLLDIIQEVERKNNNKYRYEMLVTLTSAVLKNRDELGKRGWNVMLKTVQEIYPEIKVFDKLYEIVDKHYGNE